MLKTETMPNMLLVSLSQRQAIVLFVAFIVNE